MKNPMLNNNKQLKFKFDSNLPHQTEAIDSVVDLFKGFSQEIHTNLKWAGDELGIEDAVPNVKDLMDNDCLDEDWLYGNYCDVVNNNNTAREKAGLRPDLPLNPTLECDDGFGLSRIDDRSFRFPVFTVEMETGTGKTYTYFRTIHELKKCYGFRKFIIVVPSVAIYEGTTKAFEQTKEHFKTLYGNETIHLTKYGSQPISCLRTFATSPFTEIMVMTMASFNKASNIIYKTTEKLQGEWLPYQYIQATRPILILDESQNYRSDLSRQALRTLNPLFAINYSATPIDKYNLVNRLSPVDAFRHNLVKKIKVLGVTEQHNLNDGNLSLAIEGFSNDRGLPTATVSAYVLKDGDKKQESIKLKQGTRLFEKTRNPDFQGFEVEEIDMRNNTITFTNQSQLTTSGTDAITLSKKEIFRVQIEETIKYHFDRQKSLKDKGIKVLSLFFIDRVANYKGSEPFIKTTFEKAFDRLKTSDGHFKNLDATDVHDGYFAQKKGAEDEYLDSFDTTGQTQSNKKKIAEAEKAAFNLIMKNKEQLLSFSEKTAFIFAHSALREGWDNPNVFQICTLNTAQSENRKRQEIGRGLRLARNNNGDQVKDDAVNILTVIANEAYEDYVSTLQHEYEETGDTAPPKPTQAKRAKAKRNDNIYNGADFKAFWKKLTQATDYTISIDTPSLIDQCINRLNNETTFPEPQIVISRGQFVITDYTFKLIKVSALGAQINLTITDTNNRKNTIETYFSAGYDFCRKLKDRKLSGYKIVQIERSKTDPVVHFGNGAILTKEQPITFTGNPNTEEHHRSVQEAQQTYPVFNLIERTSKTLGLTRPTIIKIFKGINNTKKAHIFTNPEGFASVFIKEIREVLANHVADRIEYTLTQDLNNYDADTLFPEEKEFPQRELIDGSDHSLYDQIQTDSDVEINFVQDRLHIDDQNDKMICYFKFPPSFKIRIPKIIGNYNPDWGIIRFNEDGTKKLELVRETKGTMDPNLLQFSNEQRKIDCAKKHFGAIGISYRKITDKIPDYWTDAVDQKDINYEKA